MQNQEHNENNNNINNDNSELFKDFPEIGKYLKIKTLY